MAPKLSQNATHEEDPPSASSTSSSEEDDQPTDTEQEENHTQETPNQTPESESESDDDEQPPPSARKPTVTRTPQPNSPSSGSDSGSDSETGPDQLTSASDFTIKPTEKKPSASKRLVTTENGEKSGGRKKKAKVEPEEEMKSGGVNRLWREDDEAVLLRGMAEFQSKKGVDPYSAMGEFHEFVKKSLSVEVSRAQLMDKVRRMKKKYENNAVKGENGSDPVFSKPHELKCFELSKKVWGGAKENGSNGVVEESGNVGNSSSKRARKTVKLEENGKGVVVLKEEVKGEVKVEDGKLGDFWSAYPCLKQSVKKEPVESFMVEGMSVVGKAKAKELERKWKSLHVEEVALYLRKVDLVIEQTKLVLDAVKASRD